MIREFIATGATLEEAREKAIAGLNAPEKLEYDVVHTRVTKMPKKKFLGLFGGQDAEVVAYYDDGVKEKKTSKKQNNKKNKKPQQQEAKPAPAKQENKQQPKKQQQKSAQSKPAPAKQNEEAKKDYPKSVDLEYAKNYLAAIVKGLDIADAKIDASYNEGVVTMDLECEDYGIIIGRRGETLDSIQYLLSLAMKKNSGGYVRVSVNIGNYREKRDETLKNLAHKHAQRVLKTGKRFTFEPMNPYERRIIHTAVQEIEGVESRSIGYNQDRRVVIEPVGGVKKQSRSGRKPAPQKSAAATTKPADYTPKQDRADLPKYGKIEVNKD